MINDEFIHIKEIEEELKQIEQEGSCLVLKLSLLSQKIKYIFSKIKICKNIEDANKYFNLLDKIQLRLAWLLFEKEIGISDRLQRFVSDFDNFEEAKKYYFEKIKNGEYSF